MTETTLIHIPTGQFDLGEIGRHPITFEALVRTPENRFGPSIEVMIQKATVYVKSLTRSQALDVTDFITGVPATMTAWEELLKAEYQRLNRAAT